MRTSPLLLALFAAACAAPRTHERAAPVPLLPGAGPRADLSRDAGMRADADRSPYVPSPAATAGPWAGAPVAFRSVVQVVEVPVAADTVAEEPAPYGGAVVYSSPGATSAWRSRRGGWFPVGTAVGAGIGAVIGNQRGHAGRGALVGSHVGLLFDFARWFR